METSARQDLIELLFRALYHDDHLSVDEDSMLQKALTVLGWKSDERTGLSVGKPFAAVREANSCEATKETYLTERAARLKAAGHSAVALEWFGKVLVSDGLDGSEELFLEWIGKLFFD